MNDSEGKQNSEDSEDLATHNSDEFTKQCKFQKLAICITSFAFLSCVFYAVFFKIIWFFKNINFDVFSFFGSIKIYSMTSTWQ